MNGESSLQVAGLGLTATAHRACTVYTSEDGQLSCRSQTHHGPLGFRCGTHIIFLFIFTSPSSPSLSSWRSASRVSPAHPRRGLTHVRPTRIPIRGCTSWSRQPFAHPLLPTHSRLIAHRVESRRRPLACVGEWFSSESHVQLQPIFSGSVSEMARNVPPPIHVMDESPAKSCLMPCLESHLDSQVIYPGPGNGKVLDSVFRNSRPSIESSSKTIV